MDFVLQRMKAVMAFAIPALATALIKGVEAQFGFDIPGEWEVTLLSIVTGIFVHQTPNKPVLE